MPKINWDGRSAGNGTWVYEGNELKPKYGTNVLRQKNINPSFILESKM